MPGFRKHSQFGTVHNMRRDQTPELMRREELRTDITRLMHAPLYPDCSSADLARMQRDAVRRVGAVRSFYFQQRSVDDLSYLFPDFMA